MSAIHSDAGYSKTHHGDTAYSDTGQFERDRWNLRRAKPVTVKLYGVKEITLPAYLLLFLSSIVMVILVVAVSRQIVMPTTRIGFELEKLTVGEDWMLTTAIWTPTAMLIGLAFEFIEAVIVLSMFRVKNALPE